MQNGQELGILKEAIELPKGFSLENALNIVSLNFVADSIIKLLATKEVTVSEAVKATKTVQDDWNKLSSLYGSKITRSMAKNWGDKLTAEAMAYIIAKNRIKL